MRTVDGPAIVSVNIFVRSISKIDDVTMVSAITVTELYDTDTRTRKLGRL